MSEATPSPQTAFSEGRSFFRRHRTSIQELSFLIIVLLVGLYITFEFDIYENQDGVSKHEETIELDEALTLGGLLSVGLLVFSFRRYQEQKRETRRRIAAEQHARELAFQDPLTGLANRRQFDDAVEAAMIAPPGAEATHAVFLLDLNGFKQVNDVHGHGVGDELLVIISQRLLGSVREGDLVARLGGDEFAILAQHLIGAEAATNIALRVIHTLDEPILAGGYKHQIGAGIGIALVPTDATTLQEALRKADVALYRAKSERRSALRFFEDEMDRRVRERDQLERELQLAISQGSIQPLFQPVVSLSTGRVVAFEAIPRWVHPHLGEIARERFIPISEDNGSIHELSAQLMRVACAAAVKWPGDVTLAFDIFPSQIRDRALKTRIISILQETGLAASRLEIEITESALVHDLDAARDTLGSLRDIGVKIALANFGTGYSSLYHLRNFKLDRIKIDRSFVESLSSNIESAKIIDALIGLGRGLGLTVTADGVGTIQQGTSLLETGCEQGQGLMFGGAVAADQTIAFFCDGR
jgi:diguanylate cyclase (GGDEF)-like protein